MYLGAGAAAFGWLETKSKADTNFFLNKIPKPIDALGWSGNTALALWIANKFVKNRWLGYAARASIMVAGYQLGRKGGTFKSGTEFFTVSGADYLGNGAEHYLDEHTMGALEAEAEMSGVPFDGAVHDAVEHT